MHEVGYLVLGAGQEVTVAQTGGAGRLEERVLRQDRGRGGQDQQELRGHDDWARATLLPHIYPATTAPPRHRCTRSHDAPTPERGLKTLII